MAFAELLRAFPLLLLVYLAIARQWRVLRWAIAGLIIGGLLTITLVGRAAFDFFGAISWATQPGMLENPANVAINAEVWRCFSYIWGSTTSATIELLRRLTILGVQLGLLVVAIKVTRQLRSNDPDMSGFSLWIVLAVMLSPMLWSCYLVPLLIPYTQVVIGAYLGHARRRVMLMALGSYGIIGVTRSVGGSVDFLRPFHALLDQGALVSLLMASIAMCWFVVDRDAALPEEDGVVAAPGAIAAA